jgi:hypothetical protein
MLRMFSSRVGRPKAGGELNRNRFKFHSRRVGPLRWQLTPTVILDERWYKERSRRGDPGSARLAGFSRRYRHLRLQQSGPGRARGVLLMDQVMRGFRHAARLFWRVLSSRGAGGLEVRAGIEPASADLQSDASPLCHRTPRSAGGGIWFAMAVVVKSGLSASGGWVHPGMGRLVSR